MCGGVVIICWKANKYMIYVQDKTSNIRQKQEEIINQINALIETVIN